MPLFLHLSDRISNMFSCSGTLNRKCQPATKIDFSANSLNVQIVWLKLIVRHHVHVLHKLNLVNLADHCRLSDNIDFPEKLFSNKIDRPLLLSKLNFNIPSRMTLLAKICSLPFHSNSYGPDEPIRADLCRSPIPTLFLFVFKILLFNFFFFSYSYHVTLYVKLLHRT